MEPHAGSGKSPDTALEEKAFQKPVAGSGRRRTGIVAASVIAVMVVLGLALGLGLGLGLKKHNDKSSSSNNANSNNNPLASQALPPWRKSTQDYALDMSWDINAAPTTREYNFTVGETQIAPDGVTRTVLAINGQYPGPIIRMNRGDTLVVHLTNNLPNATSLHWHGMFQNGTNWMDGTTGVTQCPVAPGKSFTYSFTVENQFGTYWYHAHFGNQYIDGINGPLIIHAPDESQVRSLYDFDQVIMLQDWYHDLSGVLLPAYLAPGNENAEPVPDNGLVQGTNYFNCSSYHTNSGYDCNQNSSMAVFAFEQNKRYRLRFINAGAFTPYQMSVDNHTLQIIEADGTITKPLSVHRFEIAVAERYSVILTLNQTTSTNYWIRAEMNTNCFAATSPVLNPDVRAILTYVNSTADPDNTSIDWGDSYDQVCQDLNNSMLVPLSAQQAPPADVVFEIQFGFEIGANALSRANVNGSMWIPSLANPTLNQAVAGLGAGNISTTDVGEVTKDFSNNQYVVSIPNFGVVDLIIMNFDDGSHPFHLHGHVFWVVATSDQQYFPWDTDLYTTLNTPGNGYTTNPMRRDTITIGAYQWVLLRFVNDVPGMHALHCHNTWHLTAGLLMQFMSLESKMKEWTLPADVAGLCVSGDTTGGDTGE